jgi:hypothetical protein
MTHIGLFRGGGAGVEPFIPGRTGGRAAAIFGRSATNAVYVGLVMRLLSPR